MNIIIIIIIIIMIMIGSWSAVWQAAFDYLAR